MSRILYASLLTALIISSLKADDPAKSTTPSAESASLPRYKLTPGIELNYFSRSSFKYGEGKAQGEHLTTDKDTLWVLRKNSDGSFRILHRNVSKFTQVREGKEWGGQTSNSVVYVDMFTDGRILPNSTIQYHGSPEMMFPRLPKDLKEAQSGWNTTEEDSTISAKPNGNRFVVTQTDLFSKIYLSSKTITYTFDAKSGFISNFEVTTKQGYGFNGKGTGTGELTSQKTLPEAELTKLTADTDNYFKSLEKYEELTTAAAKLEPEKCKESLGKGKEILKNALASINQADLKKDLEKKIEEHDRMTNYYVEEATTRAKIVGKPAHEFKADDLEAKAFELNKMRGKVVILDFWYRGCGWCVKAMPQMNQLTADFADKPVAILGMNTDSNKEDAEFVVKEMALKYRTLRVEHEMSKHFGVRGFPSLVIIDKKGIVRDIHVGYSKTLREEVGKTIRELLAE
ncbi:TlpA family protein disulfide reductase [Telmatocola sphagniphila]|uniref:TlpA family protein disulfide reductase n=1 Tax=Telmatocola sphagniphila TaxID=1123043 RepID=A0A8E6B5Z3_9BACT|nr:TlpA disulfide reductase family protein [Telmatocola sphagniphila]QVL31025.1 TlpA family protein disulfide reductase [Telmatocola sphagniphila]